MSTTITIQWKETPAQPISILVVDDNPVIAELTAAMAETIGGTRTVVFDSPEAALNAFQANPESWDLVLTDFHMPIMTGAMLVNHLRELRPELPAVILSGQVSENEACRMLTPPVRFVRKPFLIHELRAAMHDLLECKEVGA